jgi:arylsulfatase A-like enzyme
MIRSMTEGGALDRAARATLLALGVAAAAGCGSEPEAPGRQTNLLFVSIDTLRADHLSCYGYERETSPRLDALATGGRRFANAWTVMPTTLPSHAAMFTSLFPREIGARANGMVVPPGAWTLAERLAQEGFATGAFVSAAPLHPRSGLGQGFEVYDHPPDAERRGEVTRERAVDWLREHSGERFFGFVHLFDPHTWYTAPRAQRELFRAPGGQQPPERAFVTRPEALTDEVRRAAVDAYDAEIRYADDQLGALLDELEVLGLAERTVVVVLSDHGETLDELLDAYDYGFDHGEFLHRRELHVPLVLRVPAGLPGSGPGLHEDLVTTLDLLPTLLELVGAPRAQPYLGRSLVPLLEGEALQALPAFAERRLLTRQELERPPSPVLAGGELSVATTDWHLVRSAGRPLELFDLENDPLERRNAAADHPRIVERLEALLDAWSEAHAAGSSARGEVDPELLEALRALGYATDDGP